MVSRKINEMKINIIFCVANIRICDYSWIRCCSVKSLNDF